MIAHAATAGVPFPDGLINRDKLATLQIRKVIFHDVPRRFRGEVQTPTLSEVECAIDPAKIALLKEKLVRVLASSSAYDLELQPQPESSVPKLVRDAILGSLAGSNFVTVSQSMASALLEHQPGSASAGLLAVVTCTLGGQHGLALLKLEREEGAQLKLSSRDGKKTFEMDVLADLVLTDGTKLFKAALFAPTGLEDGIAVLACDGQRSYTWTDELAQFWIRFLGCKLREAPRITTKKFFDATLHYINESVSEPEVKNDLYDTIVSEMKSQKRVFAPKKFIEDYIPAEHGEPFREHLEQQNISMKQFHVDTSEIKSHLKRRSLLTSAGVRITVPAEANEIVDVQATHVVISDTVTSVGP